MSLTQTNSRMISNVGTGANQLVQLDANAKLPAVDGSQLTNLSSGGGNSPYFAVYRNGTQTGVSGNTWTDIVHNAEDVDSDNAFDTSTGRFTPQTAGYYQFNLTAMARDFGGSSTQSLQQIMYGIFKNTETDPRCTNFIDLDQDRVTRFVPTVSTIIHLNGSTDYVVTKVYIAGNSGSVHGERQYTNFSGFKLS